MATQACEIEWSPGQTKAMASFQEWYGGLRRGGDQHVFRLFGYAGTGKTTLAQSAVEGVSGRVLYAAFTGKAALVMRRAGCLDAGTIHSLIYHPKDKSQARLRELEEEMEDLGADPEGNHDRLAEIEHQITMERGNLKRPAFSLNLASELSEAALLVLDEVSMVGHSVANDLLGFGTPILALGDPFQLPPVGDGGFFTDARPDALLTEVHRQADRSPIVKLATWIRSGKGVPKPGTYGDGDELRVVPRGSTSIEDLMQYDQVLVGRNKTRKSVNAQARRHLGYGDHEFPQPGERVVCLRNDHQAGLLNGSTWTVVECAEVPETGLLGLVVEDAETGARIETPALREPFLGEEVPFGAQWDGAQFDYGYALTVHKAQGSQWDSVYLVDESGAFRENSANWLYTGVTRAQSRLTVSR